MAFLDAVPAPATAGEGVLLGSRAEMYPAMPLPDFDSVGGPAFAAHIKGDTAFDLIAVLCNTGLPPRVDVLTAMRNIDHPSVLRLIDSGVVHWPADGMRYFAIACQRPLAPRFKQSIDEPHPLMSEDLVNHQFVTPLIGALAEFHRTGIVHNGIRPTNIFWRIGSMTPPQLGECISSPPGPGQPVLFETLERALSTPLGRGAGTHADDCYAFGVTLALFVLGQNPMRTMDDRAVIQSKMERGTFASLVGNSRLSPTHSELLRGLLTDDARQRWTAADLELWHSGRRLTPKNTDVGRRAARAIEFAGKEYTHVRPLAVAFAGQIAETVQVIESGTLDKWLRRAMGDEERADDLEEALSSLRENSKMAHYEDQLVARVCIALDPSAPIRYRGLAVMPAGIAIMLVDALKTGANMQALAEIISAQLVTFWVNMQKELKTDLVPLGQQFERMKALIERTSLGNGVERVAYELNPGLPCLSPILSGQYVSAPKAMLLSLERAAGLPNRSREPMDRHIAAFLIVRDRRSELLFEPMTLPETSPRKGIALLTLFSEMQYRHGPDTLPNLAQWLMPFLEISVQRYLSRTLREKIQKQIRETATRGDLGALLRLIDDSGRVERDQQEFLAARILYLNILKEISSIENNLANRDTIIQSEGKPLAASFSGILAVIMVFVAVLRAIWQNL